MRLWDAADGQQIAHADRTRPTSERGRVLAGRARQLASAGGTTETVRLWDAAATGADRGRSTGHEGEVTGSPSRRTGTRARSAARTGRCGLGRRKAWPAPLRVRRAGRTRGVLAGWSEPRALARTDGAAVGAQRARGAASAVRRRGALVPIPTMALRSRAEAATGRCGCGSARRRAWERGTTVGGLSRALAERRASRGGARGRRRSAEARGREERQSGALEDSVKCWFFVDGGCVSVGDDGKVGAGAFSLVRVVCLKGYARWVNCVAFSLDGRTLASGGETLQCGCGLRWLRALRRSHGLRFRW